MLQRGDIPVAGCLALLELVNEGEDEGKQMLTFMGPPILGALPYFELKDLTALGAKEDPELISFASEDEEKFHPVLATLVRNTREGTVEAALDTIKRDTHSTLLFPNGMNMFEPILIAATTVPDEDEPGSTCWLPPAQIQATTPPRRPGPQSGRRSARELERLLLLQSSHSSARRTQRPVRIRHRPGQVHTAADLVGALTAYFGDSAQWDYLNNHKVDTWLQAAHQKPETYALQPLTLQQISSTWEAAVHPTRKSQVPRALQLTLAHMNCALQAIVFRDNFLHAQRDARTRRKL